MLLRSNEGFGDTSNLAWGGIGPARSVLLIFALCCSSLVLYIPVRLCLAVIDEDKTTSNENCIFDEGNQSGVRKPQIAVVVIMMLDVTRTILLVLVLSQRLKYGKTTIPPALLMKRMKLLDQCVDKLLSHVLPKTLAVLIN